jgi:hypothetical protein
MTAPPSTKWLEESNRIMHGAGFSPDQILAAVVWAARWQACSKCGADPYQRCENLAARRKHQVSYTKWPHQERVDRQKLVEALQQKGYAPK